MAHCLPRILSPILDALCRLVRYLFGSERVADAEDGTLALVVSAKEDVAVKDPVATFAPDLQGLPALILSTMAIGGIVAPEVSGPMPTIAVPGGPPIPRIVLTPPMKPEPKPQQVRLPLASVKGNPKRVHGRSAPKTRSKDLKENSRDHPNAAQLVRPFKQAPPRPLPALPSRPVLKDTKNIMQEPIKTIDCPKSVVEIPEHFVAVQPGPSTWDREKCDQLKQARAFSDAVKARRRSLPTAAPSTSTSKTDAKPLVRCASMPARLSLEDRLRRAVADARPSTPAAGTPTRPKVPAPPLWGDENVSFVLEEEEKDSGDNRAGTRTSTWSEVVSLDDYA